MKVPKRKPLVFQDTPLQRGVPFFGTPEQMAEESHQTGRPLEQHDGISQNIDLRPDHLTSLRLKPSDSGGPIHVKLNRGTPRLNWSECR